MKIEENPSNILKSPGFFLLSRHVESSFCDRRATTRRSTERAF